MNKEGERGDLYLGNWWGGNREDSGKKGDTVQVEEKKQDKERVGKGRIKRFQEKTGLISCRKGQD